MSYVNVVPSGEISIDTVCRAEKSIDTSQAFLSREFGHENANGTELRGVPGRFAGHSSKSFAASGPEARRDQLKRLGCMCRMEVKMIGGEQHEWLIVLDLHTCLRINISFNTYRCK